MSVVCTIKRSVKDKFELSKECTSWEPKYINKQYIFYTMKKIFTVEWKLEALFFQRPAHPEIENPTNRQG